GSAGLPSRAHRTMAGLGAQLNGPRRALPARDQLPSPPLVLRRSQDPVAYGSRRRTADGRRVTSRSVAIVAAATALVVLVIGLLFTVARPVEHESTATVVLSPDTQDPDRIGSLLESFQRSGTLGTYVELLAS